MLDARLERCSRSPVVVAVSGGGDSMALLLMAKRWSERAGRSLIAMTVDHGLQPASADWAAWCSDRASRLCIPHQTLTWRGPKPARGIPAAARLARHRLLANAARQVGARVILMGHTADDRLEASIMRAHGTRVSEPRPWRPAPVWPDGRGIFILRPLLDTRRADLRALLRGAGETWIEDPINDDLRQARARARALVGAGNPQETPAVIDPTDLHEVAEVGLAGEVKIPLQRLIQADPNAVRILIGAAVLCASGREIPPRGPQIDRLMERMAGSDPFVATLAGARVVRTCDALTIVREVGDRRGARDSVQQLSPNQATVWDGRFEVRTTCQGLSVMPLAGLAARLSGGERDGLRRVDPAARRGLPVVVDQGGRATCPVLTREPQIAVQGLVSERLAGACGAIPHEAAIWRVAKTAVTS